MDTEEKGLEWRSLLSKNSQSSNSIEVAIGELLRAVSQKLVSHIQSSDFQTIEYRGRTKTSADRYADELLKNALPKISPYPILAEETISEPELFSKSNFYWTIDPIDGTDYLLSDDEAYQWQWLVNVALIHRSGLPIIGGCAMPSLHLLWIASPYIEDTNKEIREGDFSPLSSYSIKLDKKRCSSIPKNKAGAKFWKAFIEDNNFTPIYAGSALSYLLLAMGALDILVNCSGNFHWDSAAQHAILKLYDYNLYPIDWEKNLISESELRYSLDRNTNGAIAAYDYGHIGVSHDFAQTIKLNQDKHQYAMDWEKLVS